MAKHLGKTKKRQSVLWRNSGYRSSCTAGFTSGHWEAHHIACNHALEGRQVGGGADHRRYVEDCLWITPWDLNDPKNLIGLPKNKQFRKSDGKDPAAGYVSHQVDHNTKGGYTDECKKWLKDNVWDTVKAKKKGHDLELKSLKAQLDKCTATFKRKLTGRALRKGGTGTCWANRHKKSWADRWYHPFSMASHPNKRSPGADTRKMAGVFARIG